MTSSRVRSAPLRGAHLRVAPLLTTSAAVLAGLLVASPAQAGSRTLEDPVGDVRGPVGGGLGSTPAVALPGSDVTRVRAQHTARKLVIRSVHPGLDATSTSVLFASLKTPDGSFEASVVLGPGRRSKSFLLDRVGPVSCRALRVGVDRDGDAVRLAVPRGCLGDPRWVQVGVTVVTADLEQQSSTFDVAGRDGRTDPRGTRLLGRRIGPGFQQP